MPADRHLVVEAVPTGYGSKQSPSPLDSGLFEDVEDQIDRWVSVAVFGALTLGVSLVVLTELSRSPSYQALGTTVIALGFLELVLGTFGAYVLHPRVLLAVAVASALTIVDGVLIATDGVGVASAAIAASLTLGLVCAAIGALQGVRTWSALYRDSVSAS